EGGDPAEMLGSYLPPSEVQQVARKGALTTKTAKVELPASAKDETAENKPRRRKLEFGGKPKIREDKKPEADKAKDDDDDGGRRKLRIGGRGGDDDEDGKDAKDADDDKAGPRKLSIGGRDKGDGKDDA